VTKALRSRLRLLYGLSLLFAAAGLAAVIAAPLLMARGSRSAIILYAAFSPLCHQNPGRCFFLAGFPMAVCARCAGIYGGAFLGLLMRPWLRPLTDLRLPRRWVFLAASLPLAADAAGGLLGLWSSPAFWRFAVGLIWGAILPFYFLTGLGGLIASRSEKK
jgi:uncharacterized membrane protein